MTANILGEIDAAVAAAYETTVDGFRLMGAAAHDIAELQRLCEVVDVVPAEVWREMPRVELALKRACTLFGAKAWKNDIHIFVSMAAGCWTYDYDESGVYFIDFESGM